MENLLSPTLLHATALLFVAFGILMIAVQTAVLAVAAERTALSPTSRIGVPLAVAVVLSAWFAWAILAVNNWIVTPEPPPMPGRVVLQPGLLLQMSAMALLGVLALFGSTRLRAINAATPPAWLIGPQVYRVAGALFLWPFLAAGAVPAAFAVPAGVGDVLTGIAAPFVAVAVAQNRPRARTWAVIWNLFGILDLVVATASAVLSHSTNISRFPLVIVPLFLGPPLGILLHLYSLRNLRVTRDVQPDGVARPEPHGRAQTSAAIA